MLAFLTLVYSGLPSKLNNQTVVHVTHLPNGQILTLCTNEMVYTWELMVGGPMDGAIQPAGNYC